MTPHTARNLRSYINDRSGLANVAVVLGLVLVLAFGFMLRFQAFTQSEVGKYPNGDAAKYFLYAYNLKNFGIFGTGDLTLFSPDTDASLVRQAVEPDARVTPGFPLFMSLFLGGEYTEQQRDAVLVTQVVLSTMTILIAYLAFAPVGRTLALGVATLTALSPHLVNMNLFLLTEPLFCFLLTVLVWLLSRITSGSSMYLFLAVGVALGAAALTRPWIQGYLVVLSIYLAAASWKISWSKVLLVFVGTAILVTPWLVRNKISLGFAADPELSVHSIHHGMYPDMMYDGQPASLGYAYRADPMSPELGESLDATVAELKRRAAEEPWQYLQWYLFGKTRSVLSWKIIAGADAVFVYPARNTPYFKYPRFYLSSYYMQKIHGLLMLLAIIGTVIVWLPREVHLLKPDSLFFMRSMSLLVVYFLVMHSIGAPYPRYSIPMRPILYAMGLYPVVLVAWQLGRRFRRPGVPT